MADFIPLLIVLLIISAVLREDSVLYIFYIVTGIFVIGNWWSRHSLKQVRFHRSFPNRAFLGENIPILLTLTNASWLPTFWVQIHDSLPVELTTPNFFQVVTHVGSHRQETFEYQLQAKKRGFYQVGPLFLQSGDLFGLAQENQRDGPTEPLIVYPLIVPLGKIGLPSKSPFGSLKHTQPIFEDPSRVMGKREYQSGDSLRHIDWKSSASFGRLLVKKFEPSISLETYIFMDLNTADYDLRHHFDDTELAIVITASIASWVIGQKQSVGLSTNGLDPLFRGRMPQPVPPKKGQGHLIQCLEILARIQAGEVQPIQEIIRQETPKLTWGTTLLLVAGHLDRPLLDELLQAHRRGLDIFIILVGATPGFEEIRREAEHYGFSVHRVPYLDDFRPAVDIQK